MIAARSPFLLVLALVTVLALSVREESTVKKMDVATNDWNRICFELGPCQFVFGVERLARKVLP